MATVTHRGIIQEMLDNDGFFPGDPQASSIWEYRHVNGQIMWAVFYAEARNDLARSPHVAACCLLWTRIFGHVRSIGALEESA